MWQQAPRQLILERHRLHLWRARLSTFEDGVGPDEKELRTLLTSDEVTRAERYRFAAPRARFVVGRALLRCLLAWYRGVAPEEIRLSYSAKGKPYLSPPARSSASTDVHFNVAHAGDLILYVFAAGRAVGIDVEANRPVLNAGYIERALLSPRELEVLRGQPEPARSRALLRLWTRKEAFGKAIGTGVVAVGHRSVIAEPCAPAGKTGSVEDEPGTAAPMADCQVYDAGTRYWIHSFEPAEGCVGAVAAELLASEGHAMLGDAEPAVGGALDIASYDVTNEVLQDAW